MDLISITCPPDLPDADIDRIEAILNEAGVPAEIIPQPSLKGGTETSLQTILIVVPVTLLTTLAQDAAHNTYLALTRLLGDLRKGSRPADVSVPDRRILFEFTADIRDPDASWLRAYDLIRDEATPPGIYRWDNASSDWFRP